MKLKGMRSDKPLYEERRLENNEDVDPAIIRRIEKEIAMEHEGFFKRIIRKIFSIK